MIKAMGMRARGCLHREHHQVPSARKPHAGTGRVRNLLAISDAADRHHQAEGYCGPGRDCGQDAAAINAPMSELRGTAGMTSSWYEACRDLPSCVSAARSPAEEGSLERFADGDEGSGAVAPPKSSENNEPRVNCQRFLAAARAWALAPTLNMSEFCDVALPVPLDIVFTYAVPEGMQPVVVGACLCLSGAAHVGNRHRAA